MPVMAYKRLGTYTSDCIAVYSRVHICMIVHDVCVSMLVFIQYKLHVHVPIPLNGCSVQACVRVNVRPIPGVSVPACRGGSPGQVALLLQRRVSLSGPLQSVPYGDETQDRERTCQP